MSKLKSILSYKGTIKLVSNLQINGPENSFGPGGYDSEVVKNALTGLPYIPGSSIKGKMRSSLEEKLGIKASKKPGLPCGCGKKDCMVCTLFGAHMNTKSECGTSRLLFRDAQIKDTFKKKDGIFDTRTSTMIDRITHTASNGSLRAVQVVSAGVEFDFEILLQIYEGDNEAQLRKTLEQGIELLNIKGLGGKTTSGNGQVKIDYTVENIM